MVTQSWRIPPMISVRALAISLLLAAVGVPAWGQELRPWKHGVIEPKGDAGFMLMVGQRDFASKRGLKIEIVPLKNGATAHKALLAGELHSIRSNPDADILGGAGGAEPHNVGCKVTGMPHCRSD